MTGLLTILTASGQTIVLNIAVPVISGTAIERGTLTASVGTWIGESPITYAYQWKAAGVNVGTNSSSYTIATANVGKTITCTVTATNRYGSVSATSAETSSVALAPPTAPVVSTSNITSSGVTLSWTASTSGTITYDVYNGATKLTATPITATTYNVTGLSPLTAYTLYVKANNAAGTTSSSAVNVTTGKTQLSISYGSNPNITNNPTVFNSAWFTSNGYTGVATDVTITITGTINANGSTGNTNSYTDACVQITAGLAANSTITIIVQSGAVIEGRPGGYNNSSGNLNGKNGTPAIEINTPTPVTIQNSGTIYGGCGGGGSGGYSPYGAYAGNGGNGAKAISNIGSGSLTVINYGTLLGGGGGGGGGGCSSSTAGVGSNGSVGYSLSWNGTAHGGNGGNGYSTGGGGAGGAGGSPGSAGANGTSTAYGYAGNGGSAGVPY